MVVADLGEKVAFLEGLLGFAFSRVHFEDQTIAEALKIDPAQWSRKKKGAPVRSYELGRLFAHLKLPRTLDHEVFLLPDAHFRETLKQAEVGIYGEGDGSRVRQRWLVDPHSRRSGVRLRPVRATSRGGFGLDSAGATSPRPFQIGGHAMIHVDVAAAGHLLVFNDSLRGEETTSLAPSVFLRTTAVPSGTVTIPAVDTGQRALDVQGPPGWYRVFAIWSRLPIAAAWIAPDLAEQAPRTMSTTELVHIDSVLQERRAAGEAYAILSAEYQVAD
jgi:hypothetical protein